MNLHIQRPWAYTYHLPIELPLLDWIFYDDHNDNIKEMKGHYYVEVDIKRPKQESHENI